MASEFIHRQPARGDVVSYHGKHYFYQPFGTSCMLYDEPAKIGSISDASCKPPKTLVFLIKKEYHVTPDDTLLIKEGKLIKSDDSQPEPNSQEELWRIIDFLSARIAQVELQISHNKTL